MSREIELIRSYVDSFNAAQAAEIFLSPHIAKDLLNQATATEGPSMWIINRSDVFDGTLALMSEHPISAMALRASEKLRKRKSPDASAIPPALEMQIAEIHESSVEDILGHPLAPWEAIDFFGTSVQPAQRASAALSLTRRLLEFPPNQATESQWLLKLKNTFSDRLLSDSATYVRAYCARIPLWDSDLIDEAVAKENDPSVMGRLLQHPNVKGSTVEAALLNKNREVFNNGHIQTIGALDARISEDVRRMIVSDISNAQNFISAIHSWYLNRA